MPGSRRSYRVGTSIRRRWRRFSGATSRDRTWIGSVDVPTRPRHHRCRYRAPLRGADDDAVVVQVGQIEDLDTIAWLPSIGDDGQDLIDITAHQAVRLELIAHPRQSLIERNLLGLDV